ncbi:MAG TPA: ATP-binding protein [Mycobacteriales bacterium]|nr:ATP-binding protein [Mycobacteriales bacterium]
MSVDCSDRIDLLPETSSVAQVRVFVRRCLSKWGLDDLVDVVALLANEVATNAVLHARTTYAVVIAHTRQGVRVDVLDCSHQRPAVRRTQPDDMFGRGLPLVIAFASEWGPTPTRDLKGFAKGVRFTICT